MLACIYLSYIFSIVCGVNIYIYLGLYCCPHNSLSSTSLKSQCFVLGKDSTLASAGDMGWLDRVKGVGIQQDKAKQGREVKRSKRSPHFQHISIVKQFI